MYDSSGNYTYDFINDEIQVTNPNEDIEAPMMHDVVITPNKVKVNEQFTIKANVMDNHEVAEVSAGLYSPFGVFMIEIPMTFDPTTNEWVATYKFAEFNELGNWTLEIYMLDSAGNFDWANSPVGIELLDTTGDITPPFAPTVDEVNDKTNAVTGLSEPGSTVEVKAGENVLGTATAAGDGSFNVAIPLQAAGNTLTITAKDEAGNVSEAAEILVKSTVDIVAPVLVSATVAPASVTVGDKFTITAEVTDDNSGVSEVIAILNSVGGFKEVPLFLDNVSGKWVGEYRITTVDRAGKWFFDFDMYDQAGNFAFDSIADKVEVINPDEDIEMPTLQNVVITPEIVKAGESFAIKATVLDNNEVAKVTASLFNPSGTFIGDLPLTISSTTNEWITSHQFTQIDEVGVWRIEINMWDSAGNFDWQESPVSVELTNEEADTTAPAIPVVNEVTDQAMIVTGIAESGSNVEVKAGATVLGTAKAGEDGSFSITIPVQLAGTTVAITATDSAGNESENAEIVVKDVTAPAKPVVNEVTDQATVVTGTAEVGSMVDVRAGETVLGTATAGEDGGFSITIPIQTGGTTLTISTTDVAGNMSEIAEVTVKDITAPAKPVVKDVTNQATVVAGTAENGSKVEVKSGDTVLGTTTTGEDGSFMITIPVQVGGTKLAISTTDAAGNKSEITEIVVKDIIAPAKPVVNEVTDKATVVTGTAEKGLRVEVKSGDTVLGTAIVREDGSFSATIPVQPAGTHLVITATDSAGNVSETTSIAVVDKTSPAAIIVNEVTDRSTAVTGTSETKATITVKIGSNVYTGVVDANGNFKVNIPQQKAGTNLTLTATDAAGNVSEAKSITVVDKTPPAVPTVNEVTDQSITVVGKSETKATITVLIGNSKYTGIVDQNGNFKVNIPKQKAGTKIIVTSKDVAGNVSASKSVTVVDKTAPVAPTVNVVSDQSTTVTGKSELKATITVLIGANKYTGTVDLNGNFKVTIPKQKAGTKITVTAKDVAGNVSAAKNVTVVDKTPPSVPTVNEVSDKSGTVTGKSEPKAAITISIGTSKYSGIVDLNGNFKVTIPKQKAGTKITVTSKDVAGNVSAAKNVTVVDKTAPVAPTVNEVSDQSTTVTGKSELKSTITVSIGTSKYLGTVDLNGNFKITIPKQKAGTKITVVSKDAAGNMSTAKNVTVVDKTAPSTPTVNEVSNKSTTVTGKSEPKATITVSIGTSKYTGTVDQNGNFKVIIPLQKVGTKITVTSKDNSGNVSTAKNVTVVDRIAPAAPRVYYVTEKSLSVRGESEPKATIIVVIGKQTYSGVVNKSGYYNISIPKQKAGTVITIKSKDASGNVSKSKIFKVIK
jgi:hypothetical protein